MPRILVIDSLDGDQVRAGLLERRHTVVVVASGSEGLLALPIVKPHIVVMDHMLSDQNGLMLMPRMGHVPMVVLSAADDQQTRVMALRGGADDFLSKPWSADELSERVAAVIRRSYRSPQPVGWSLTAGELVVSYGSAHAGDRRLDLTKLEHKLLETLANEAGRVVSQEDVLESMYGNHDVGDWNTVVTHLGRLRKKLRAAGVRRTTLRTVRGRGLSMDCVSSV